MLTMLFLALVAPGAAQFRRDGWPLVDPEAVQAARRYMPLVVVQLPQPLLFPASSPLLALQTALPSPTPVPRLIPMKVAEPVHVSVGVLLLEAAETEPAVLEDENLMMLRIWQRTRMQDARENGVVLEDIPKIPGFRERIRKELGL